MRRFGISLFMIGVLSSPHVFACGDKYVVLGQGVRFQRAYAANHPAAILIYLRPGSKWATDQNRERLLTVLRMVGHRPDAVATLDEMQAALSTNKYDIVLTEFATADQAVGPVGDAKTRPTVVPIVFDPTRAEMAQIEKQNNCTVQVSKRNHELLTVINTVMDQRIKGITEGCRRKSA